MGRARLVPLTRDREDRLLSAIAFADRAVRDVERARVDLAYVRRELRKALAVIEGPARRRSSSQATRTTR